jgi:hypothetical protein
MKKNKPNLWGVDKDGNFTIDGKKATNKQSQHICTDLKINLPENFPDILPELEKKVQMLARRRSPKDPRESVRKHVQAISKRLLPEEILRSIGPTSEPGFSRVQRFFRLIVLQAQWDGISPRQVIDQALGKAFLRKPDAVNQKVIEETMSPEIEKKLREIGRVQVLPLRLLKFMWGHQVATHSDLVPHIWGDQPTQSAIKSALSRANNALLSIQYDKSLSSGGGEITWK